MGKQVLSEKYVEEGIVSSYFLFIEKGASLEIASLNISTMVGTEVKAVTL